MIEFIKYSEIDFQKYEECLLRSDFQNFTSQKKVLDFLCKDWSLVIYNDYEFCAPISLHRKLIFQFALNPLFCQQLGIYGSGLTATISDLFLDFILKNIRLKYYSFNYLNHFSQKLNTRNNFVIPSQDYFQLKKKFFKGRKSTLKKTENLAFAEVQLDENHLNFIKKNIKGLDKKKDIKKFFDYLIFLKSNNYLISYAVYNESKIISLALIIKYKNQYNLLGLFNLESEKRRNGSSFIIDQILQVAIGKFNFNFMGGNISGIGLFFKSFGAETQTYPVIENSKKDLLQNFLK